MGTESSLYQDTSQLPVGVSVVIGPQGNDGAAVPVQYVSGSGSVTLDYSLGKHVVLTLTGNITALAFINWPLAGNLARLTVEVHNTGNYSISGYPSQTKWSLGHTVPVITLGNGAEDWLAFTTTTAGSSISGHYVGQNYT